MKHENLFRLKFFIHEKHTKKGKRRFEMKQIKRRSKIINFKARMENEDKLRKIC